MLIFLFMKISRPSILEYTAIDWVRVLFLSFPNLAEGITGVITSTILLLGLSSRVKTDFLSDRAIYIIAVVFSAVYVLLQEFKVHNLGGNNVYDFNDVLFSIVGLSLGFGVIWAMKPTFKEQIPHDPAT